jgi:hypothetical protein
MSAMTNGKLGYGPVGGPVDIVKAARDLISRCGEWPYVWSYPPPQSEPAVAMGTIALPALATETEVANFRVAVGKFAYFDHVMLSIVDGNYVEGLGFANWTIDVNQPAAAAFAIGRPVEQYGLITTQMGSPTAGPVHLPYGFMLCEDDEIRVKITLPAAPASGGANPLVPGFPQTTTCWLLGYTAPVERR